MLATVAPVPHLTDSHVPQADAPRRPPPRDVTGRRLQPALVQTVRSAHPFPSLPSSPIALPPCGVLAGSTLRVPCTSRQTVCHVSTASNA